MKAMNEGWKPAPEWMYAIGDRVTIRPSTFRRGCTGRIVGFYSSGDLLYGYVVEDAHDRSTLHHYSHADLII